MVKSHWHMTVLLTSAVMLSFIFVLTGCSGTKLKKKNIQQEEIQKKKKGVPSLYYDFDDVLIPGELKMDNDSTFIYRTPGYATGIQTFKGRVELNSLIKFFKNNMAKDNWRITSYMKASRAILQFQKENRCCMITIQERDFSTEVEIWVAPTINETESGLLK